MKLSGRLFPLDGIRGVAALCIMIHHFPGLIFNSGLMGGSMAVDIFFILSGIVLTHVYEQRIWDQGIHFKEFFLHRIARLYPLHLFTLIVILCFFCFSAFCPAGLHNQIIFNPTSTPLLSAFLNLLLLNNAGFGGVSWDPPSWSISVEIVMNILWFWLLRHTRSSACLAAIIALSGLILMNGCGLSFVGAYANNAYGIFNIGLMRGLVGFLFGVLCYRHFITPFNSLPSWVANLAAFISLGSTAYIFRNGTTEGILQGIEYPAVFVIFPLLILSSLHAGTFLHFFFSLKPTVWLGEISYSLYMLHWIFGMLLTFVNGAFLKWNSTKTGFFYLGCMLLFSTLCYHFLEKPCREKMNALWKKPA